MASSLRLRALLLSRLAQGLDINRTKLAEIVTIAPTSHDFLISLHRLQALLRSEGSEKTSSDKIVKMIQDSLLSEAGTLVSSVQLRGSMVAVDFRKAPLIKSILKEVLADPSGYGRSQQGAGRRVVVEFSSPNIAKPFHAGHLRSTIIGNVLSNLYGAQGFSCHRVNYLGDWGKQFGLLDIGLQKHGSEDELARDPIRHLFDVYVAMNKAAEHDESVHRAARDAFYRLEQGDSAQLTWQRLRALSIDAYQKTYKRLNTVFDEYSGESLYWQPATTTVMQRLRSSGVVEVQNNGAEVANLISAGLGHAVVRKEDGTSVYLTRDIAAAEARWQQVFKCGERKALNAAQHSFEKMVYVAGTQQNLYFQQLFHLLSLAGHDWASRCSHVGFGMVNGMSTRRGSVVFLEDLLNEAKDRMRERIEQGAQTSDQMEHTAEAVGLAAIVVQDLKAKRIKDYEFQWDRMLQAEGDTGPLLMYTYARCCGIEGKSTFQASAEAAAHLTESQAEDVVLWVSRYEEACERALQQAEPSTLVNYLLQLARYTNAAHAALRVQGAPEEVARARLAMFASARTVLGSGLKLLGLTPLERI